MMRSLFVDTPSGRLGFFYRGWSGRQIVVLIHGFGRGASQHFSWESRFPDHDVVFGCLPSHGDAPPVAGGLANYIRAFRTALSAFPTMPDVVLGESFGALIALTIKARLVVGIDPFLRTKKLWPVHAARTTFSAVSLTYLPLYNELLVDQDYTSILRQIVSPALVIAGDQPLLPQRWTQHPPSLLDEADERCFRDVANLRVVRIPGGHQLLDQQPDLCHHLIVQALAAPQAGENEQ